MKNQFIWIITTIFVITLLFNFTGCKEPEPADVTPPAEFSYLKVNLVASTLEKTNQDVEISVNIVPDNIGSLKQLFYTEGVNAKIDDVIANGTDIFATKKFTVSQNGTYTVAAIDTAGRRELSFITISNIDKTAPSRVSNVIYSYSRNTNKILLIFPAK